MLILLVLLGGLLSAEDIDTPPTVFRITVQVIVSEPAPVETSTLGTALEIDRGGARTVFDAVDQLVPGAFVTRRGVMGYGIATNGTGGVSIRGIGESPNTGVLIVVDGRPDMQGLMGHPLPDFYTLSNAASVNVTEGPASVLYGSNAMGGAIEIVPARPAHGTHTRLSSSLGSFLTGQHRLTHGTQFEKGFYTFDAAIDHSRGERNSAAYRSQDASLGMGYDLSAAWKASLQGRYGHFHVKDPGPLTAPLANSYANVGRGGFTLALDNAYSRTWGYMRFYSSHGLHIITDGFRSVDSTTGVRVLQSFSLTSRLTLDAGTEAVSYGGRATNVSSRLDYGEHHITTAAGFSRLQWNARSNLRLNTGLRYEHNSVYGNIAVPEFGASYKIRTGYTIAIAAGKGFRNPTIRELYLFPAPNPLLQPEILWNYQATVPSGAVPILPVVCHGVLRGPARHDRHDRPVPEPRLAELRKRAESRNRGEHTLEAREEDASEQQLRLPAVHQSCVLHPGAQVERGGRYRCGQGVPALGRHYHGETLDDERKDGSTWRLHVRNPQVHRARGKAAELFRDVGQPAEPQV